MPKFQYTASNMSGQTVNGVYEATDEASVRYMLRQKSFYPIQIKEITQGAGSKELKFFSRIPAKDLTLFCQQFAAILKAGVPLSKGLEIMSRQCENKSLREVLINVHEKVQTGRSLSASFRDYPDRFPSIFFSMLEAGEVAGTLDHSLERLGIQFQKEHKITQKVKGAMIYPAAVGVTAIVVIWFLLSFVVPRFTSIFDGAGAQLPGPTRLLIGMSEFVGNNTLLLVGIIMIIVIMIRMILKTRTGRFGFDRMKLRLPIIGKLNIKVVASRFTRTLSTLFSSGVPLTNCLEITARAINNLYVETGLLEVTENVKQGRDLASTLGDLHVFPPMVEHMTRVGEESGTLENMLLQTAEFYESEADAAISKMMALMEPLIIVVLGGIVMFIVISVLLPMLQMLQIMH